MSKILELNHNEIAIITGGIHEEDNIVYKQLCQYSKAIPAVALVGAIIGWTHTKQKPHESLISYTWHRACSALETSARSVIIAYSTILSVIYYKNKKQD